MNAVPTATYKCLFRRTKASFNKSYSSPASVLANDQLQCDVPYIEGLPIGISETSFITVALELELGPDRDHLKIKGTGSIRLYSQPTISDYSPKQGSVHGGTTVTVKGYNLDPTLGGIKCKFGTTEVDAIVVELKKSV